MDDLYSAIEQNLFIHASLFGLTFIVYTGRLNYWTLLTFLPLSGLSIRWDFRQLFFNFIEVAKKERKTSCHISDSLVNWGGNLFFIPCLRTLDPRVSSHEVLYISYCHCRASGTHRLPGETQHGAQASLSAWYHPSLWHRCGITYRKNQSCLYLDTRQLACTWLSKVLKGIMSVTAMFSENFLCCHWLTLFWLLCVEACCKDLPFYFFIS